MKKLSRVGDQNQVGGKIVRGANSVYANGKKVGLHASLITPHHKKHNSAKTTSGSPSVYCEGAPVLRVTSGNSCGHSIITGSDNVFVP